MNLLRSRFASALPFVSSVLLVTAMMSPIARADEYSDVNQLARSGKTSEALARADQYLAGKPRDPQMRFIKSVIQADAGNVDGATATLTKLIEDYPELSEPYNNLAVIYAGQGLFDKARAALEMAVRNNPAYATAHENLGDVYARLAAQSYSRAQQLDGANKGLAGKLTMLRNMLPAIKNDKPPVPPAAKPAAVAAPAASKPASAAARPASGAAPKP